MENNLPHMTVPDQAELNRLAERSMEQNQGQIIQSLGVQTDEKGKARLFGMEVPRAIAPALNIAVATALIPLSKFGSSFVYNQTKLATTSKFVTENFPKLAARGPKVALGAELATMWGLFAARPIAETVSANKRYATHRHALSKELRGVCEGMGCDYRNNEVIREAFKDLHQDWVDDMKMVIPSVISVTAHAAYGIKMHSDIMHKRGPDIEVANTRIASGKEGDSRSFQEIRDDIAVSRARKVEEMRQKEFKDYQSRYSGELNDYELKQRFNEHWQNVKENLDSGVTHGDSEHKKSKHDNLQELFNFTTFAGIAQGLGEGVGHYLREQRDKKEENISAYELIKRLKDKVDSGADVSEVHADVIQIFQRVEEDADRAKFAGGLLDKLEERTKPIAEMIATQRLDPLALVKLAGEDKVVIHGADKRRNFHTSEQVEEAINEMLGSRVNTDHEVTAEDFIATFANPLLAEETLKKNLKEMQGEERDFFIAVIPTELLEKAGLKRGEINESRRNAHQRLYDQVAASILHIAAMSPEMLQEYGISKEDVALVQQASNEIHAGNFEQLKLSVDSQDPLLSAIAQVTLGEQIKGENSWTARVQDARSLEKVIANTKQENDRGEVQDKDEYNKSAGSWQSEEEKRLQRGAEDEERVLR